MDDLIRRQDAIDAVMGTEPVFSLDSLEPYQKTSDVIQKLEKLPSAQQNYDSERRNIEWENSKTSLE